MQRNNAMQLAAALCLMLGTFPLWYWYATWAVPEVWMVFAFTGGSLVLTAAVWLHRRYGFALERKSLLLAGILARAAAILLGVGSWFLAQHFLPQTASVGAGILVWLCYLTAWEMLKLPEERLLSVHAFILLCVAFFSGWLLCRLQEQAAFGDVNFLMLGVNAAVFCILRNRLMLSETTAGRPLPKGFRLHNLGLLVCFLVPGAVLFSCRNAIASFAGTVLHAVWTFLIKVLQLMSARLYQDGTTDAAENTSVTAPTRQGSTWLGLGIQLVVLGLVVFLVIRFRSELWDFLRQIAAGLFRLVRQIVLAKAPAPVAETHPEYTDSVELLDTAPVRVRRKRAPSWGQYYRRYKRIADPAEKYRAGYALWMRALRHWHAEVPPNAVPARLLELSSGIPDPVLTERVTGVYYRVRYGGYCPTGQELAEMDRLVGLVRKTLLTVRYRVPETQDD